jgi:LacI family transcriptional regulator
MRRIALLMGQDIGYSRGVLRGVHNYAVHKTEWVFHDCPPDPQVLTPLKQWRPHGIIAHLFDPAFAKQLMALRKPVVNTTSTLLDWNGPLVEVDHLAVGRMAAEHFLERGFTNFGYFGSDWTGFSKLREQGFRNTLAEKGFSLSSCHAEYMPRPPLNQSWTHTDRRVSAWLAGLPKPAAILASNDVPARRLAEICHQLSIRVPEEIALLGVDNDELECWLSSPPLSSVVNPAEQIGYEAARLLDQWMSGERPANRVVLCQPPHLVTRQSTDITAIADPLVSTTLAFIHAHASENIGVAAVVRASRLARRSVERRFRELLGRTIHQEIQRVRIERAKSLLAETVLPVTTIARRCGFSTPQRLAAVFQQVAGESPSVFRRRVQWATVGDIDINRE